MPDDLTRFAATLDDAGYVARAQALAPLIAAGAADTDTRRRLSDDVVAALHEAGLFRLFQPHWLGGGEAPPAVFVETIERIARADPSTAWCLCQMSVCSIASVYLQREIAREIFGPANGALAWGSTPDAKAVKVAGGYRVSGKWEFGSGCHHATWLGGHCPVVMPDGTAAAGEDGQPLERTVLFPRAAARILDAWNVIGLRGTGSDEYVLDDLFVPEDHTILALLRWPDAARCAMAMPYRFGASALYASGFAAVGLGNARAMLDAFIDLAKRKVPRWGKHPLADNGIVQAAVAEADTRLAAARVYLVETLREAGEAAMREGGISLDRRMKIRAAGTYALRLSTGVVDQVYELAGTSAIFDGAPFERRFRDAHTVSQHLQGRISHFETVGKHLLGIPGEPRFV